MKLLVSKSTVLTVCYSLTFDPVMDVFVEVGHVLCEVEEEVHGSQNHAQVGMTKTIIQNIL